MDSLYLFIHFPAEKIRCPLQKQAADDQHCSLQLQSLFSCRFYIYIYTWCVMLADRVQLVQNCICIVCLTDSLHFLKQTPPEKVRVFPSENSVADCDHSFHANVLSVRC